jgi:acetyl-CoA carboxylase biotin carboxyl carrier protein
MDFSDIERILALVREHDLAEFELERDGLKVRVRKAGAPTFHAAQMHMAAAPAAPALLPPAAAAAPSASAPAAAVAEELESLELAVVKSPIVGTFYRSSAPDAKPFVAPGDRVAKGQVLCIVEAMKLMNEIESDCDGEVLEVMVANGQPVEFGEPLFRIRTAAA